ncbi:hypothetical protein ER308_07150 [Egibacter rhizosphaerae]|uniref:Uncharacterized protein n=1 Tax=Egibacter rhizosphaerae TaxID=1670831 RepID=A0A411YDX3_9ACTN|nr:hypothetical protein [Egibacter rhizosphaerae]QBI19342.1 hypothetical protein ER308_07150 [Egibacter rhizosphaerae]
MGFNLDDLTPAPRGEVQIQPDAAREARERASGTRSIRDVARHGRYLVDPDGREWLAYDGELHRVSGPGLRAGLQTLFGGRPEEVGWRALDERGRITDEHAIDFFGGPRGIEEQIREGFVDDPPRGRFVVTDAGEHYFVANRRVHRAGGAGIQSGLMSLYGEPERVSESDLDAMGERHDTRALDVFGGPMGIERTIHGDFVQESLVGDDEPRDRDALNRIRDDLSEWGLGSLADWVWEQIQAGRSETEIMRDLRDRPEYQQRFPSISERREQGLTPVSEQEVIQYEEDVRRIMRQSGMPEGFYDSPQQIQELLVDDLSPREVEQRVQEGFVRVDQQPEEVLDAFGELFGANNRQALASFILDPDRSLPQLERAVDMAGVRGAGSIGGFQVSEDRAERIAGMGFGFEEAQPRFQEAGQLRPLADDLPWERGEFTEGQLVDAAFEVDVDATERMRRRQELRQSPFEGAGGALLGQEGLGVGPAD